jgi:hypothetical protein
MVLNYQSLPIIEKQSLEYDEDPRLFLRYKYSPQFVHNEDF